MSALAVSRRQLLSALLLIPLLKPLISHANSAEYQLTATFAYNSVLADQLLLIDIRTPHEWRRTGIPAGAYGIDMDAKDFFKDLLALANKYPARKIALISTTGGRSAYLARYLGRRGVSVYDIPGGIIGKSNSWKSRSLPFSKFR